MDPRTRAAFRVLPAIAYRAVPAVAAGRAAAAIACIAFLAAACAGCGAEGPRADRGGSTAGAAPAAAVHVISDAGDTVRLARPARRVISLIPATTELLQALGAGGRLVARTDYDEDPRLADLPSVGGGLTPSLESIAARRPELVVAWVDGTSRAVVRRIRDLGIAVYAARYSRLADIERTARSLGTLLGREAAADSLLTAIHADLDAVRAAVADRPRPEVLYAVWGRPPRTAGRETFITELIRIAGGRNAFRDLEGGWPEVSLEEMVRRQPDVLLLPTGGGGTPSPEALRRRTGWRELDAVRRGRVIRMDGSLLNRPGPRIAEAARFLAERLHPEAFGREAAR